MIVRSDNCRKVERGPGRGTRRLAPFPGRLRRARFEARTDRSAERGNGTA